MRTVQYRRWSPPQSSVRIEFTPEILHEIRAESRNGQDRGYLFGLHVGDDIRVLAAIRAPRRDDPRLQHWEPVGVYVSRARGEVFLTDADLEQVDRVMAGVALVVVGGRAGFFTRELDGKIQAVRSHEEFSVAEAAAQAEIRTPEPRLARLWRHPALAPVQQWKWAAGVAALLIVPVAAFAYLTPYLPKPPLELSLKETQGQLLIAWDPRSVSTSGRLEIDDRGARRILLFPPGVGSATYGLQSGDVEVRISTDTRSGVARWTSAKFITPLDRAIMAPTSTPRGIALDIDALRKEAKTLRRSIVRSREKVKELSLVADKMLLRQRAPLIYNGK
ncbi:MAG: hypothetical protein ABI811_03735 [Acidobacteriota bacterium]